MMPARRQSWWNRFLQRTFPPRDPQPTTWQRTNTMQEQDEEAHWRHIRDRYDTAYTRFNQRLEEIRARPERRRGRRHDDL